MFKRWREDKRERATHNSKDFECIYWKGNRRGEGMNIFAQKCKVCRG